MKETNYGPNHIGNVIRILDNRSILVNVGRQCLKIGDTIQIYELGPEIKDHNGTILCRYEFIKDELEVIEVNENYSRCKKKKTEKSLTTFSKLALSPMLQEIQTPLMVDETEIEPLKIQDPFIHIGDPIKLA